METENTLRRRRRTVLLLLTIALLNLPAVAVATHVFADAADTGTHAAGIHYVAEAGITTGCTPTAYCPTDTLTRAQMGTFLHRASGNATGTPPSVNAASVTTSAVRTVTSERTVTDIVANHHRVTCPEGTVVIGGGGASSSLNWVLVHSGPLDDRTWEARYRRLDGAGGQTTTVFARCLSVGP